MIQRPDENRQHWTAKELLQLPADERDAILEAAALLAVDDYLNDPDLTAFDAFAQEPLDGESDAGDGVASEG